MAIDEYEPSPGLKHLEACLDALDHIVRVCGQSHRMTKRTYWIQARAQSAIDNDEAWRAYDYPRNRQQAKDNLRKRFRQAKLLLEAVETCPVCANAGYLNPQAVGEDEFVAQRCEWCHRREELLK